MASVKKYHKSIITLHWLIAIIVFLLIGLGLNMVDIERGTPERAAYYNLHKSFGVTLLLLMIVRIYLRIKFKSPNLPSTISLFQQTIAKTSHFILYLSLVLMPLSGLIASQFTKYGVKYFGLFKIPPLFSENKFYYDLFQNLHKAFALVIMIMVSIHIFAAFKHIFVDKDEIFQRISLFNRKKNK
jgi:cytochrome b561